MKRCSACKETKPLSDFTRRSNQRDGYNYYCRQCSQVRARDYISRNIEANRARAKAWREKHPARARASHDAWVKRNPERVRLAGKFRQLRYRYGLSRTEYENLIARSNGKCELCGGGTKLAVDHCHASLKVRGILCIHCNTAVARFDEMSDFPERVATYLKKHQAEAS